MSYRLIPGVRQYHTGKLYQLAVYDRTGKVIEVPYSETLPRSYPELEYITVVDLSGKRRRALACYHA